MSMPLPFKAAVYRNYFEASSGLYRQGFLGFYKGNGVRCAHIITFHKLNTEISLRYEEELKRLRAVPLASEFLLSTAIDMLLHPLHLAESRFILQNRNKQFQAYSSLYDMMRKSPAEFARGISLHAPRNMCIALTGL